MRLDGKTVFMTAAGAGIGRASAVSLAAAGAKVTATSLNEDDLSSLAAESDNIVVFAMDATDGDAITAAAERVGAPDILLNCSGFVHNGTVLDVEDDDFDFSFNLNVRAHFRIIKAFLPAMIENGGGSIINMASVASSIKGAPNRCLYGATKAAVIGLTKAIATDFIGDGIRCNAICPGSVDTPSLNQRMEETGDYDAARQAFIDRAPTGRMAEAAEIAALVVYLASDDAEFITGQTHIIDGGWSL